MIVFLYEFMGWDPMVVFKKRATPLHLQHVRHLQNTLFLEESGII